MLAADGRGHVGFRVYNIFLLFAVVVFYICGIQSTQFTVTNTFLGRDRKLIKTSTIIQNLANSKQKVPKVRKASQKVTLLHHLVSGA
jgi:hypothetical protein